MKFAVQSLSCGYYDYVDGELVYSSEAELKTRGGRAKFTRTALNIYYHDESGKNRIEIPYRIVEALAISTRPPALTLTLWEAPRLFWKEKPDLTERLDAIWTNKSRNTTTYRLTELPCGDSGTHEILSPSLVYRMLVSPSGFDLMTRKLHEQGALTIYHYDVRILSTYEQRSMKAGLQDFTKSAQQYV